MNAKTQELESLLQFVHERVTEPVATDDCTCMPDDGPCPKCAAEYFNQIYQDITRKHTSHEHTNTARTEHTPAAAAQAAS